MVIWQGGGVPQECFILTRATALPDRDHNNLVSFQYAVVSISIFI